MKRLLYGLAKETRPLPVIATLAVVYLAFLTAGAGYGLNEVLFFIDVFFCLYTVHFIDTYVDFYVRKEDKFKTFGFAHGASGILKKNELIAGAILSSAIFLALHAYLSLSAGFVFFILMSIVYFIGISYSHYISRNSAISVAAYPFCLALAMSAVYTMVSGVFGFRFIGLVIPVFLLFLGSRAWMDIADSDTDKKTGKPNFSLAIGKRNSKLLVLLLLASGLAVSVIGAFSATRFFAAAIMFLVFYRGFSLEPKTGSKYIMPGVFAFVVLQILFQYAMT